MTFYVFFFNLLWYKKAAEINGQPGAYGLILSTPHLGCKKLQQGIIYT